jgi:M6 family metalloprotease-like protein
MVTSTPWAFILFKFSDENREPQTLEFYKTIFTASGRGTHGIVDYWEAVSHGQVDLGGSAVFGWFTIDQSLAQWRADFAQLGMDIGALEQLRQDAAASVLIEAAQARVQAGFKKVRNDVFEQVLTSARRAEIPVEDFFGVVAVSNATFDLWGSSTRKALISGEATDLGGLAHEMGHGYGLGHSMDTRREDYTDWWDIMSYANCAMARFPEHSYFTANCGTGLNAAHLLRLGWLDPTRVVTWMRPASGGETTVRLSALSSPETGEALALRVNDWVVAFRFPEGWDNGLPRPCVTVHTEEMLANSAVSMLTSVLQTSASGRQDGQVGDVFHLMPDNVLVARFSDYLALRVDAIDSAQRTATVSVIFVEGSHEFESQPQIQRWVIPGVIGIGLDGQVVPVPPRQEHSSLLSSAAITQLVNFVDERIINSTKIKPR